MLQSFLNNNQKKLNKVFTSKQQKLVSIVLITYNSEQYVAETLESIALQTYENIELIISDDFSIDNTVAICQRFLENNKDKFHNTHLITVSSNTGIPANCNRGIAMCNGEWIKLIAGDDVFYKDAIENFVLNVEKKNSLVVQTNTVSYQNDFQEENTKGIWKPSKRFSFFEQTAISQYKMLMYRTFLHAPGVFFAKELFLELQFDIDFPKIEDYPFWILITVNGIKIDYLDINTVKYRIHENSVQFVKDKPFIDRTKINQKRNILQKYYPDFKYSFVDFNLRYFNSLNQLGINSPRKISAIIYKTSNSLTLFFTYLFLRKIIIRKNNI